MNELTPGIVTNADLYRELVGIRSDVGRALTHIEVINVRNTAADRLDVDHETRIRTIEAWKWKVTGMAVAVGTAAGIVAGIVAAHVH